MAMSSAVYSTACNPTEDHVLSEHPSLSYLSWQLEVLPMHTAVEGDIADMIDGDVLGGDKEVASMDRCT
jgi:hypothetical protein